MPLYIYFISVDRARKYTKVIYDLTMVTTPNTFPFVTSV